MMRFCAASHEQGRHLGASTPEFGTSGASRSRPSWAYTELLCYRLSCTAARLGLATGGISRNWTSSTCAAFAKFSMSAGRTMCQTRRSFAGLSSLALKPCWTRHSFAGQDMSLAWTTADSQNNCSMLSSQLVNGTKAGRGSGTKMCWNWPSRPATSQLTSGKPWPRTGRPGGQLYARAQSTLREADYRAWMIRDRQGRTECQTLALLYLVSSAARSALPLSGSKLICANTSTDASSSYSKDYYYLARNKGAHIHTLITSTYIYDYFIHLITTPLLWKSVFVIQVKVLYLPVSVTLARQKYN